jgi:hypothetical protein
MLSSVSTTVLLILAGVVGLLVGLLISALFNREPKSSGEPTLPEALIKEGYVEAARLLYSPASKKVITQLDGDNYKDFLLLTPEQKKRVLRLLQTWMEWSGQSSNKVEAPSQAFQAVAAKPEVIKPFEAIIKSEPTPSIPVTPLDVIPVEQMIDPVALNEDLTALGIKVPETVAPIPAVISFGQKPKTPTQKEPLSIVEQINEVIEKLTAGTPDEQKGIHLEENGQEGVIVWVGGEHYNGVDAVPYPEIQTLIRAAVVRWEEETEKKSKS